MLEDELKYISEDGPVVKLTNVLLGESKEKIQSSIQQVQDSFELNVKKHHIRMILIGPAGEGRSLVGNLLALPFVFLSLSSSLFVNFLSQGFCYHEGAVQHAP